MQDHHADGRDLIVTHLLDAIRQVRQDVAKVELWAEALGCFSQPVPDYNAEAANVWFPTEQATALKRPHRPHDAKRTHEATRPQETSVSFDEAERTRRLRAAS
jgi:hypothetical protein